MDVVNGEEVIRLFRDATLEAEKISPSSPAVALGVMIRKTLDTKGEVPVRRAVLAAQLLIPLCPKRRMQLKKFLQTAALLPQ